MFLRRIFFSSVFRVSFSSIAKGRDFSKQRMKNSSPKIPNKFPSKAFNIDFEESLLVPLSKSHHSKILKGSIFLENGLLKAMGF